MDILQVVCLVFNLQDVPSFLIIGTYCKLAASPLFVKGVLYLWVSNA